jgi:hypothetical protein
VIHPVLLRNVASHEVIPIWPFCVPFGLAVVIRDNIYKTPRVPSAAAGRLRGYPSLLVTLDTGDVTVLGGSRAVGILDTGDVTVLGGSRAVGVQ